MGKIQLIVFEGMLLPLQACFLSQVGILNSMIFFSIGHKTERYALLTDGIL